MKKIIIAGLALFAIFQPAAAQAEAIPAITYIHAGRLLANPADGRVETKKTIVVEDGHISGIRDGFVGEGKIIDLSDQFVLPGFIDGHVHLTLESGTTSRLDAVTKSITDQALDGVAFSRRTVRAGFTTVVDLGADPQAINALRDAIAAKKIIGPRIIAAGVVAVHGGHGDIHGYRQEIMDLFRSSTLCSGADDCTRAVRQSVQQGADIIKTASTGGVMSNTTTGLGQQMSDAELSAIVETAHRLGRKVAAHAHGTDGVNAALRAGVDSIEHGTYLDEESIRLFNKKGSYLVPTLLAGDTVTRQADEAEWMPAPIRAKARTVGPLMVDALSRAYRGGVRIAFGTDSAVSAHGDNAREFALMVKAGLTPLDAIRSATIGGADHIGLKNDIGSLAVGKVADIVAVKGNPLGDVRALEAVTFVMARGAVVRAAGH